MLEIEKLLELYINQNIALYGLGTETERFLSSYASTLSIIGLLDGFKASGELYGYPIITLSSLPHQSVSLIIVIARPGSCKAIAKRIGEFCTDNNIALFDVRGRDLLSVTSVSYDFKSIQGSSKADLLDQINSSDIISFDLFNTLVMRKVKHYTDVFDLLDCRLRNRDIYIPDFPKLRLFAEKELSKSSAPRLLDIYERVLEHIGGSFITASELADLEWELDFSLLTVRTAVKDVFKYALSAGKKVVVTTDSYYDMAQIEKILYKFELIGFDNLFVSCEYNTAKTQELFNILSDKYGGLVAVADGEPSILHIGDDEYADVEKAESHGLKSFRIYSAADLLDDLGGLGLENYDSLSDRVKVGLFLSHIFNSPFWFEKDAQLLSVKDAYNVGYLFCAPMITDFIIWMKEQTTSQGYNQILFGARDGYLMGRLFRMVGGAGGTDGSDCSDDIGDVRNHSKSYYFLTSRTAAIRAGMESEADIEYVDSMKYFGSPEEALRVRFGIEVEDAEVVDKTALIIDKSRQQRANYKDYIDKLCVGEGNLALFDFVAKGTTQMYLSRLFKDNHMKGFYFLQLEPEFMADKGLDIKPFYSDEEKNTSAIFDNYYILETMLTSPYPQMLEMDDNGRPVFAEETRSGADIEVFKRAQEGIEEYFKDYISIVPGNARTVNKELDERLLELVNKVQILDKDFLNLKVEDPFFGRMTDIKDVIG